MNYAESILGRYQARQLQAAMGQPVLQVGSDRLTRADLARVECYNFTAARLLTHAIASLDVPNLRHLFEKVTPAELALPRVGTVSLAVLGAAFEARGIGGERPLEAYALKHANGGDGEPHVVTWDTLKSRAQADQAQERKETKRRKHARRNRAHAIRVDRFVSRAGAAG